jgi:predicted DNA-binding protein YlxM (UPF0122 family)
MLTSKQNKALKLLVSGEFTQREIAEQVKVSEQTICAWKKNDEFTNEYERMIRQSFQSLAAKAKRVQADLLSSKIDMVRYMAAKDILDRAGYKPDNKVNLGGAIPVIIREDVSDE